MAESFLTLMADFSEADQQRMARWYDALQQAGFRGAQTAGLPHHVSIATFPLEQEAEAVALTRHIAASFAPVEVDIRRVGVFPGGRVLFAEPDRTPELTALHLAAGGKDLNGYPWSPHATMLIDEPEMISAALTVLTAAFTPFRARIDRLHLCAFWPTREILRVNLTGDA